jgi:2-Cys peroxiredoxin 5
MAPIKVGDKIPSIELHHGFPPEKINAADYVKGKKVIILGLPGACSPSNGWS